MTTARAEKDDLCASDVGAFGKFNSKEHIEQNLSSGEFIAPQ